MALSRFLLLACACLLLAVSAPRPVLAQENLAAQNRAAAAIDEGQYGEAISILNPLLVEGSQNVRAYLLRAQAYEGRGNHERALADYRRVLELDGANRTALDGIQRATQAQGNSARTNLDGLGRLADANPNDLQYRLRYADALYNARLYREAAAQYAFYLDRTQGTPDVVKRYLIALAGYPGDNAEGERAAARYLSLYPTDDDLHMRLGYFRYWQSKNDLARQAFEQALLLNPSNEEAKRGLDLIRNPQQATAASTYRIDVLARQLRENPNQDDVRFELVDELIKARRFFEAQQNLTMLAPRYRDSAEWQRFDRLAQAGLQRTPGPTRTFAIDRLLADLRKNPDQDEKRFQLAAELIKFKRYAEAYDQLAVLKDSQGHTLADEYGESARWLDLFVQTDEGFARTPGGSPVFPIDRFTYLLRANPSNAQVRYALVDALLAADRAAEAFDVLTDPVYADPADERYQTRLQAVTQVRQQAIADRLATLERRLANNPGDPVVLRELADQYLLAYRVDDAIDAFVTLLTRDPDNLELRARYAEVLRQTGRFEQALAEANFLRQRAPQNPRYQRLYALAALSANEVDATAEQFVEAALERDADDVELLLALASYRLSEGRLEDAAMLVRRADTAAKPGFGPQIETFNLLLEREAVRVAEAQQLAVINDARRLAADGHYARAIEAYEDYFLATGRRSRAELKELAYIHSAANDYEQALSILTALQEQLYEYDVEKEIAKNQLYRQDYSGAIATLQGLMVQNPNDYEVRLLLGDAYRELGRFSQARALYQSADSLGAESVVIKERQTLIEIGSRFGVAQSDPWSGFDYVGLVVPTADATVARGGGTRYDRWAQGLQTQVTLPAHVVLTAGVNSHFVSGTRRLVPGAETTRGRINQVFAGGYWDLTPPVQQVHHSYTNRLSGEVGLFDYEGGRTVPFGELRYWHQTPGLYRASIGLRTTEGSIALWSPAGGEFDLRLTQIDLRGATDALLPDSTLKLDARLAFNIVRDDFGNPGSDSNTNFGTNIQLDAGYRVLSYTYLGVTYYQIDYRTTTDLYFSPRNYSTYDLWLEYEREMSTRWYVRLRGSVGIVAQSNGFISRRVEAEWVYRIARRLSFTFLGSLGQSTRTLGSTATSFDRYSTFIFSGALYWTL